VGIGADDEEAIVFAKPLDDLPTIGRSGVDASL